MSTDVAITFDIEFDINGAFANPDLFKPAGRETIVFRDKGRDPGLGHILDILDQYGIRATFFIETAQTAWFGSGEMGDVARLIHDRGHELQLHLHPVWLQFLNDQWREATKQNPPIPVKHDSLPAMSEADAVAIIDRGIKTFEDWGLPAPTTIRTGSLITERGLYNLFARCGLTISSSVGLGLYQPGDNEMRRYLSPKVFDGVLELPVSSYLGADHLARPKNRLATVRGMGIKEQQAFIDRARRLGCPCLVLLSHVSEFCKPGNGGWPVANRLTSRKFHQLCRNISESPGLGSATVSELADKFHRMEEADDARIRVPRAVSMSRFVDRARFWG